MGKYLNIYIDKGTDYSQTFELSIDYVDYDFVGNIRKSLNSPYAVPFEFEAVSNEPKKVKLKLADTATLQLRGRRAIYDVLATHKVSGLVHKELEGVIFINEQATYGDLPLPPRQQITLSDIADAGTAAGANIEDFATAQQGVDSDAHIADLNNPHEVTKTQVGLGNVDNTSDLNKPISTATQAALNTKETPAGALEKIRSTWNHLATSWTTPPTLNTTIVSGDVYNYVYGSTTYYRLVPSPYNSNLDTFYSSFSSGVLSSPITSRGMSLPI